MTGLNELNSFVDIDWQPDKTAATPIYKQIIEYISSKVSSGDWVVGKKLPSQRKLAEIFKVNRSTIVAAMDELISYGMLESEFGGGTKVASNTWSILMAAPPDWNKYIHSGSFKSNLPTIQTINKLEFESSYIRIGTGELSPELFPHQLMNKVFRKLPSKIPSLNYLGSLGLPELRNSLSKRLAKQGIDAPPSTILITSGALQGLQLISVCMLNPGSTIFTEAPTYLKSLQVFQSAGMKLSGVPMDGQGIMYWQIKKVLHGSLLYTIPTHQNPTGIVMPEERRKSLFDFCRVNRLPMIEDNAYGELWFDQEPPAPIKAMDKNGMILYLGTISKTFAPGLRIGWLIGPESVVDRIGDVKMQVDYGASSVSQWALTEFFESGYYDDYILDLKKELRSRRDLAIDVLNRYLSDLADWNVPNGGFYIWLRFRKVISIDRLFQKALENKILLNPGNVYDFATSNSLRLSYAYASPADFEKAIKIVADLVTSLMT
ncbi:PLP-dependent aminotransferase family protein [Clostridium aminobutyricum]|uniref:PLP-dependent aminotransferase family protein n=1 Tax=Clostridium aminobutyricum TaxID=33953 RepID=A0A939D7V3_CLOAM|nr:PLP-dependent aminotransferase family protein [Clostridium aminobutyricum]MBN7772741.1 PLP-dependent aminotransferase family protein [Clostridium aminobutyricum]